MRASLLGIMAGMRSASPAATLSRHAVAHPDGFKKTIFAPLTSRFVSALITLGQIGEIVADKLPILPSRIDPQPLAARVLAGGVAGAAVFTEVHESVPLGIAIGASSALVSSYAFYYLRREISKALHIPDPFVAIAEDLAVLGLGAASHRP
jgi:uncharacterized membrane protein